jgi:hypothetical protein
MSAGLSEWMGTCLRNLVWADLQEEWRRGTKIKKYT